MGGTKLIGSGRGPGDWIIAKNSFGFCDERDESRGMPNDKSRCSAYDIPTSDTKFWGAIKHCHPDNTIQYDEKERNQIDDIQNFKEADILWEEGVYTS